MTEAPDSTPVLDLLEAFRRSKTMFAAVSLGVFDALAAGPKSLDVPAGKDVVGIVVGVHRQPDLLEIDRCYGSARGSGILSSIS